ncbi:MAG: queuosine precursor transporter [Proteobacteria bacterium]|nr:queuosine precursor transporter [Pseudomonadota bacterium]
MDHLFAQTASLHAKKREMVFLALAGLFLSTLAVLNVIGLTRILNFSFSIGSWTIPIIIPIGLLPYPITFICLDLITEFFGKERARLVIWMGLAVNLWIVFILWIGGLLPPEIMIDPHTKLPLPNDPSFTFFQIRSYAFSGVLGSMIAYLIAQFLDVQIFQWCYKVTKGKHLWFRSNVSTLTSQLVDTIIIDSFAFCFTNAITPVAKNPGLTLISMIIAGYTFKLVATLLSTLPFYIAVYSLRNYFNLPRILKDPTSAALMST